MPNNKKRRGGPSLNKGGSLKRFQKRKGKEPAVRAKSQYDTWPRCPLKPGEVLEQLQVNLPPLNKYFIAQEDHEVPPGVDSETGELQTQKHIHAYLSFNKKEYVRFSKLSLTANDKEYRGNYQACRDPVAVVKYCSKDGDYITNFSEEELKKLFEQGAAQKLSFADVIADAKKGKIKAAYETFVKVAPRDAILRGPGAIKANLEAMSTVAANQGDKPQHKFKDLPSLRRWDPTKYCLVIVGGSGWGKTQLAKSLFNSPFLCTNQDQLAKFSPEKYDGIIFDDWNFQEKSNEYIVHLLGVEESVGVNVKYGTAPIPAGFPRVVTRVHLPFKVPLHTEIKRRIHVVGVWEDIRLMSDVQKERAVKPEDDLQEVLNMTGDLAKEKEEEDVLMEESARLADFLFEE